MSEMTTLSANQVHYTLPESISTRAVYQDEAPEFVQSAAHLQFEIAHAVLHPRFSGSHHIYHTDIMSTTPLHHRPCAHHSTADIPLVGHAHFCHHRHKHASRDTVVLFCNQDRYALPPRMQKKFWLGNGRLTFVR